MQDIKNNLAVNSQLKITAQKVFRKKKEMRTKIIFLKSVT